jgi:thioredoxin 1
MIELTNEIFEETVLKSQLPVMVDFSATWCGPCKKVAPIVEKIGEDYAGKVVVVKCDVEECDEVARRYGIMNIPTVLYFKNGEVVDKNVGAAPEKVFVEKLEKLL